MTSNIYLWIALAAVFAVALAFYMYGFRSKLNKSQQWLFGSIRFLTVFTILLLLINPKIVQKSYQKEKPKLVVLFDNSSSIKYLGEEETVKNILATIESHKDVDDKFEIESYSFGEHLKVLDSLSFSEAHTQIHRALQTISQRFRKQNVPLILISDGNQTLGRDYAFATYSNSIFPVVIGDTTTYSDVSISRINTNRYAYLKNEFPVEAFVNYLGNETVTTTFEIKHNNAVVYTKKITLSPTENTKIIQTNLPASRVGVQQYTAEIQALDNEKNTNNNRKPFAVEVIDQATNILIVSDITHPDVGALQRAIASNEQRKVTLSKPADALNNLEDYQLVVLYQPTAAFQNIYQALINGNSNHLVVGGLHTDWRFVNRMQPFFSRSVAYPKEDIQPRLNTNYSAFSVEDIGFSRFPPLQTSLGIFSIDVPFSTLFEQQIQGVQMDTPMLFSLESEAAKIAVWDGEGLWRWRAYSYVQAGDFKDFDRFFGNFIQYLASGKRSSRLEVSHESFYNSTDQIRISAQYFDKTYVFDPRASLQITIKHSETEQKQVLPLVLKNNFYEVNLSGLLAGNYTFTIENFQENISRSGSFQILDFDIEQQFFNPNLQKLTQLATNTQGSVFFPDEIDELITHLLNADNYRPIEKSVQKIVPLLDWKLLLLALAILLAFEWFARKYNGLI